MRWPSPPESVDERSIKREIAQTNSFQKPQPANDLAQYRTGNLFFTRIKLHLLESFNSIVDRQRRVLRNTTPTDLHRQRIGTQTPSIALATD